MWSLVIAVVLALFATVSSYQEFQCKFESENLKVERDGKKPGTYVWGNDVEPYVFDTKQDLHALMRDIEKMRLKFYENNVFDSFESYRDIINQLFAFSHERHIETKEELTSEFIADYQPKNNHPDGLGLLLKFLREISEQHPELKEHIYISVGTDQQDDYNIIGAMLGLESPAPLSNEYLFGIIKIAVQNTTGYVILDVEYPLSKLPCVMEDDVIVDPRTLKFSFEGDEEEISDVTVLFSLMGSYVHADKFKYDENEGVYSWYEKTLAIYVGQPLCSFVDIHNFNTLNAKSLSLSKFDPHYTKKAYFVADFDPEDASTLFVLGTHKLSDGYESSQKISFESFKEIENDENKMEAFHETERAFGVSSLNLTQKILKFERGLARLAGIEHANNTDDSQ